MKLPYSEGSVFLVPLRTGGFARGVVSRSAPNGKILFGYFFGPRINSIDHVHIDDLQPSHAILKLLFGDLGLINREWTVVGKMPNWDRSSWPMPDFARRDPTSGRSWIVRYSDVDPSRVIAEGPTDSVHNLSSDMLSGYGAVEIKLTKLLEQR
jgi:hypothetical protein